MHLDLFLVLIGFFLALFLISYVTKFHPIGIISGLYILVFGILFLADPLEFQTGFVFSGVNNSVVTHSYDTINSNLTYMIGLILIGMGIIVMYKDVMELNKK